MADVKNDKDKSDSGNSKLSPSQWKECESEYNLSRHSIAFMQESAFYAEISRHVQKKFTRDIPTLAVTFNKIEDELIMWVNPDFMEKQTHLQVKGCIRHEYDHLIFGHLAERRREPMSWWNIGADLAINSLIVHKKVSNGLSDESSSYQTSSELLPQIGLIPGQRPYVDPEIFAKQSPENQKATTELANLIESLPRHKSSEYYFNKVCKSAKSSGCLEENVLIESMDDHGGWESDENSPGNINEYVEGKIKSIIEKAVRKADADKSGWGDLPSEIRDAIRNSLSTVVNWRNVLRQFVGTLSRGNRTTSIKRINRRYPYIHPGTKRSYVAKLLIAIDMSGSVDNEMLETFFAELSTLTKKVDVTILPFDCSCDSKDVFEWKKGAKPKLTRVRCGGTDFNAPTEFVNDPKNRGKWDGILIMTDGQAPSPVSSRIKRGWILGKGCKLNFESNEIQISLSNESSSTGAWR